MTPDFDAMSRLLVAAKAAYEIGDDKRVRSLGYLLSLGVNDLLNAGQSEGGSAIHSAGAGGFQAGAVRADRSYDPESRREGGSP